MPVIQIISGDQEGAEIAWNSEEILIGKEDSCAVKISDAGVSRRHARVAKREGGWFVEDLGSSNGTYVNFKKRSKGEPTDLNDRDIIFIGRTVAKFWINAPASGGGAASATELRDLLRGTVPIHGLTCPSCSANIESDLKAKVREAEQVEVIRRLRLHEVDQGTLDKLLTAAKK